MTRISSCCLFLWFAALSCIIGEVRGQIHTIVTGNPRFQQLKVLRPYETFMLYFQVPSTFVGDGMTLADSFALDGWNVSTTTLRRLNSTHLGFAQPVVVADEAGFHNLVWTATGATQNLSWTVEVSCTDGDVCNGMERLVWKGKGQKACVSTKKALCDDGIACTDDVCNNGICSYTIRNSSLTSRNCPSCLGKKCKRDCKHKVCGSDGCGGQCGPVCEGDNVYCIKGKCLQKDVQGTCKTPHNITNLAVNTSWSGLVYVYGDTREGVDMIIPRCNAASTAPEIMYLIKVPANSGFIGLDARVHSTQKRPDGSWNTDALDTVMQIIEVDPDRFPNPSDGCLASNTDESLDVACADDSTPPGSYASRVTWMLKPGYTYFIQVDGYSQVDVGPFVLELRFTPECTLQCSGKLCGASNCLGMPCGQCPTGQTCTSDGRSCIKNQCKPKCKKSKKACGSDSCGNSCGTCDASKNEFCLDGECAKFPPCNPLLPKCAHKNAKHLVKSGCPKNKYCASDCTCRGVDDPLPDLAIAAEAVIPEIVDNFNVEPASCALAEGCLGGTGLRRILKFATDVYNQGMVPFDPPNPPESRPDLFEWASCHGHFHFQQFAKFELLNAKNQTIVEGQKRSYCAMDSIKRFTAHPLMPCTPQRTCSSQGVSVGWLDSYGPDLDCQFLDITGIPAGNYYIKQCANFHEIFPEKSYENNCIQTPVVIPPPP